MHFIAKGEGKVPLEQPTKTQSGSRCMVLLFL